MNDEWILKNSSEIFALKSVSSVTQSCLTLCHTMDCSTPGFPVHHQLLELAQTHVHQVSDAKCPLLLLPSIFPSIRVFYKESAPCIRWPKVWSFSFNISPSNEYSGLTSFRIDWFDLLAVPGTLKCDVQKHQFFGTQLSSQSNSHIHTRLLEKP